MVLLRQWATINSIKKCSKPSVVHVLHATFLSHIQTFSFGQIFQRIKKALILPRITKMQSILIVLLPRQYEKKTTKNEYI